jgi:hypothetical protein
MPPVLHTVMSVYFARGAEGTSNFDHLSRQLSESKPIAFFLEKLPPKKGLPKKPPPKPKPHK